MLLLFFCGLFVCVHIQLLYLGFFSPHSLVYLLFKYHFPLMAAISVYFLTQLGLCLSVIGSGRQFGFLPGYSACMWFPEWVTSCLAAVELCFLLVCFKAHWIFLTNEFCFAFLRTCIPSYPAFVLQLSLYLQTIYPWIFIFLKSFQIFVVLYYFKLYCFLIYIFIFVFFRTNVTVLSILC